MDSSVESKAFHPCIHQHRCLTWLPYHHHHHHHHHFHVSPHCPFHSNMMLYLNNHSPACPLFNLHALSQNSLPAAENMLPSESKEALSDAPENVELEEEEEEDEDPVFVLTDEWREFFAKSEAKRRQEKKQAKKKGKK